MESLGLRRACDRCYSQKLRCQREGDICTRCVTAGTVCIWSPTKRQKRVKTVDLTTSADLRGEVYADSAEERPRHPFLSTADGDMPQPVFGDHFVQNNNFEEDFFDFNFNQSVETPNTLALFPDLTSRNVVPESAQEIVTDWSTPTISTLSALRTISSLNLDLHTHAINISHEKAPHSPSSTRNDDDWKGEASHIDETFQCSRTLITVLHSLYPNIVSTPRESLAKTTSTPHQFELPSSCSDGASVNDTPNQAGIVPDNPFLSILFTCYSRLLEIYDNILSQIGACIKKSSIIPPSQYLKGPSVQIGSFSAPQSSSLQVLIILSTIGQLLEEMRSLTSTIAPCGRGPLEQTIPLMIKEVESQDRKITELLKTVQKALSKSKLLL